MGPERHSARISFAPQRFAKVAYLVSIVAMLLFLLGMRRARMSGFAGEHAVMPHGPIRRAGMRPAAVRAVAVAIVVGLPFGLPEGGVAGAAAGLLVAGISAKRLLIAAVVVFAGVLGLYLTQPSRNLGGFNFRYALDRVAAHWLGLAAIGLIGVALIDAQALRRARRVHHQGWNRTEVRPTRLAMVIRACCVAALAFAMLEEPAFAARLSVFARLGQPIAIAATPTTLLTTTGCGLVMEINARGSVRQLASLPRQDCVETGLAISDGRGGFAANQIYVAQGQDVIQISPDGLDVNLFASIPSLPPDHDGLTFDRVGRFSYNLIVTGSDGQIWRVDAQGHARRIAQLNTFIEGPAVGPATLPRLAGQVFVAAEHQSRIVAVSPEGHLTSVAQWPDPEGITFLPEPTCKLGASDLAFFVATGAPSRAQTSEVRTLASRHFASHSYQALVTSEARGLLGTLTLGPASARTGPLAHVSGLQEGSAFALCDRPRGATKASRPGRGPAPLLWVPLAVGLAATGLLWRCRRHTHRSPYENGVRRRR